MIYIYIYRERERIVYILYICNIYIYTCIYIYVCIYMNIYVYICLFIHLFIYLFHVGIIKALQKCDKAKMKTVDEEDPE